MTSFLNLSKYLNYIFNYLAVFLGSLVLPRLSEWLAFNFRDQGLAVTSSYSSSCSAWADRLHGLDLCVYLFLPLYSCSEIDIQRKFYFLSSYLMVVSRPVAAIT